jgi:4'-phosphopantetheinyl transferase
MLSGVKAREETSPFDLAEDEIQIWFVRLTGSDEAAAACGSVLGEEEVARAERFHFPHLRREFTFAHGVLRLLLARYLGEDAKHIRFAYGEKQKPKVASPATEVDFNMSHSGSVAIYAFARRLELGIDIERIRSMDRLSEVAESVFCSEEIADLDALSCEERLRAFFACWTRKEAYIKAMGDGLYLPLDSFRVTLQPADPVRFLHLNGDSLAAGAWTLCDVPIGPEFVAALAHPGPERKWEFIDLGDGDTAVVRLRSTCWEPSPSRGR